MAKQNLLLVDADLRSVRVLEVSLRKAGYNVASAGTARDALSMLEVSRPDLVLCDTRLPAMDGFELIQEMRGRPELAGIPLMILSSDVSVETKVRGLELGVEDYLTKPIYIKELLARVNIVLQRKRREGIERLDQGHKRKFSGSLSDMGVVDLLQAIDHNKKSGVLYLTSGSFDGAIYFCNGAPVDAAVGRLRGSRAIYRTLLWTDGTFEIDFREIDREDHVRTSMQAVLMEGLRRVDEWGRLLEQLPNLDTVFEVSDTQLMARLAEIPDEINSVLREFDGERSLWQIVDACDADDLETLTAVSKLYFEGLLYNTGRGAGENDTRAEEQEPLPELSDMALPHISSGPPVITHTLAPAWPSVPTEDGSETQLVDDTLQLNIPATPKLPEGFRGVTDDAPKRRKGRKRKKRNSQSLPAPTDTPRKKSKPAQAKADSEVREVDETVAEITPSTIAPPPEEAENEAIVQAEQPDDASVLPATSQPPQLPRSITAGSALPGVHDNPTLDLAPVRGVTPPPLQSSARPPLPAATEEESASLKSTTPPPLAADIETARMASQLPRDTGDLYGDDETTETQISLRASAPPPSPEGSAQRKAATPPPLPYMSKPPSATFGSHRGVTSPGFAAAPAEEETIAAAAAAISEAKTAPPPFAEITRSAPPGRSEGSELEASEVSPSARELFGEGGRSMRPESLPPSASKRSGMSRRPAEAAAQGDSARPSSSVTETSPPPYPASIPARDFEAAVLAAASSPPPELVTNSAAPSIASEAPTQVAPTSPPLTAAFADAASDSGGPETRSTASPETSASGAPQDGAAEALAGAIGSEELAQEGAASVQPGHATTSGAPPLDAEASSATTSEGTRRGGLSTAPRDVATFPSLSQPPASIAAGSPAADARADLALPLSASAVPSSDVESTIDSEASTMRSRDIAAPPLAASSAPPRESEDLPASRSAVPDALAHASRGGDDLALGADSVRPLGSEHDRATGFLSAAQGAGANEADDAAAPPLAAASAPPLGNEEPSGATRGVAPDARSSAPRAADDSALASGSVRPSEVGHVRIVRSTSAAPDAAGVDSRDVAAAQLAPSVPPLRNEESPEVAARSAVPDARSSAPRAGDDSALAAESMASSASERAGRATSAAPDAAEMDSRDVAAASVPPLRNDEAPAVAARSAAPDARSSAPRAADDSTLAVEARASSASERAVRATSAAPDAAGVDFSDSAAPPLAAASVPAVRDVEPRAADLMGGVSRDVSVVPLSATAVERLQDDDESVDAREVDSGEAPDSSDLPLTAASGSLAAEAEHGALLDAGDAGDGFEEANRWLSSPPDATEVQREFAVPALAEASEPPPSMTDEQVVLPVTASGAPANDVVVPELAGWSQPPAKPEEDFSDLDVSDERSQAIARRAAASSHGRASPPPLIAATAHAEAERPLSVAPRGRSSPPPLPYARPRADVESAARERATASEPPPDAASLSSLLPPSVDTNTAPGGYVAVTPDTIGGADSSKRIRAPLHRTAVPPPFSPDAAQDEPAREPATDHELNRDVVLAADSAPPRISTVTASLAPGASMQDARGGDVATENAGSPGSPGAPETRDTQTASNAPTGASQRAPQASNVISFVPRKRADEARSSVPAAAVASDTPPSATSSPASPAKPEGQASAPDTASHAVGSKTSAAPSGTSTAAPPKPAAAQPKRRISRWVQAGGAAATVALAAGLFALRARDTAPQGSLITAVPEVVDTPAVPPPSAAPELKDHAAGELEALQQQAQATQAPPAQPATPASTAQPEAKAASPEPAAQAPRAEPTGEPVAEAKAPSQTETPAPSGDQPSAAQTLAKGRSLEQKGKKQDAINLYAKAIEQGTVNSQLLSRMAFLYLNQGKNALAETHAQRAADADETNSEAWIVLGAAQDQLGKKQAAEQAYRSCAAKGQGQYVTECKRMLR